MRRLPVILATVLLSAPQLFAQWMMPAHQVSAVTNTWTYIPTTNDTAQKVFDWLDDILPTIDQRIDLDGGAWTVLPDTNSLQSVFDWIDVNWNSNIVAGTKYLPGTNIVGYSLSGGQWIPGPQPASNVFATGSFPNINPGSSNAQAILEALDLRMGYANSNLNVASVAGSARWAYNNGYVGYPTYAGNGSTFLAVTNGRESAVNSNTNVLFWGSGANANKLYVNKAGAYFVYAYMAAFGTNSRAWFCYMHHRNSLGASLASTPISSIGLSTSDATEGSGVLTAFSASVGDYFQAVIGPPGTNVFANSVGVGAFYMDAYKIYNSD